VETGSVVVGGDEDMVGAPGPIPERVLRGDESDGRGYQTPCVPNRWEPIDGAEVAGNVDGHEEKVSFIRIKSSHIAV
jgi:hypothetical protein